MARYMMLEGGRRLAYTSKEWKLVRKQVLERDEYQCVMCRAEGKVEAAKDVDHIVPLFKGGAALDPSNLQGLCRACHRLKTAEDIMPLRRIGCDENGEPYGMKDGPNAR